MIIMSRAKSIALIQERYVQVIIMKKVVRITSWLKKIDYFEGDNKNLKCELDISRRNLGSFTRLAVSFHVASFPNVCSYTNMLFRSYIAFLNSSTDHAIFISFL